MSIDKLTKTNFHATKLPSKVPAEKVNEIIDLLNAPKFDTINEFTSGSGVTIDGLQLKDGGIRHGSAISYHGAIINENIQQDLTTTFVGPNTAINVATYYTAITTGAGGANAIALAAASLPGVVKKIKLVVDAADAVITVVGSTGLVTITLNDVGDFVKLISMQDLGWRCIENNGCTLA